MITFIMAATFIVVIACSYIYSIGMLLWPIALLLLLFYLFRKLGFSFMMITTWCVILILPVLVWSFSGLFELSRQCEHPAPIDIFYSEKIGPIDTLLIDGPGFAWLAGKIDIERTYRNDFQGGRHVYSRSEAKNSEKGKSNYREIEKSELRSRYKVVIEAPTDGKFMNRYISKAWIKIEDRETGIVIAKTYEPAWGGGFVGKYIWHSCERTSYLSCGYASSNIGRYRYEQRASYDLADKRFLEKVFILK